MTLQKEEGKSNKLNMNNKECSPEMKNILEKPMPLVARWGVLLVIILIALMSLCFYLAGFFHFVS